VAKHTTNGCHVSYSKKRSKRQGKKHGNGRGRREKKEEEEEDEKNLKRKKPSPPRPNKNHFQTNPPKEHVKRHITTSHPPHESQPNRKKLT